MAAVRKCRVVGVRKVEYTRRNTGEAVKGVEYYISYHDPSIQGVGVGSMFFYDGQLQKPLDANSEVLVYHDTFRNRFTLIPQ